MIASPEFNWIFFARKSLHWANLSNSKGGRFLSNDITLDRERLTHLKINTRTRCSNLRMNWKARCLIRHQHRSFRWNLTRMEKWNTKNKLVSWFPCHNLKQKNLTEMGWCRRGRFLGGSTVGVTWRDKENNWHWLGCRECSLVFCCIVQTESGLLFYKCSGTDKF